MQLMTNPFQGVKSSVLSAPSFGLPEEMSCIFARGGEEYIRNCDNYGVRGKKSLMHNRQKVDNSVHSAHSEGLTTHEE